MDLNTVKTGFFGAAGGVGKMLYQLPQLLLREGAGQSSAGVSGVITMPLALGPWKETALGASAGRPVTSRRAAPPAWLICRKIFPSAAWTASARRRRPGISASE